MNCRRRSFFTVILYLFCSSLAAQNLVPNPSFEAYNSCPNSLNSIPYSGNYTIFPTVQDWTTPLSATSPDYFHDCAPANSGMKVPQTAFGIQPTHTGAAYAGIIPFQGQFAGGTLTYDYREYIQTRLAQPMVAGRQYCVSFYVSPTVSGTFLHHALALDEVGIHFSTNRPVDTINRTLTLPYHIKSPAGSFFTDTNKWYKVTGVYTASGGEQWLTLGTFKNTNMPSFLPLVNIPPNPTGMLWSYLFVDDVSVLPLTTADTLTRKWDTTVCLPAALHRTLSGDMGANAYLWSDGSTAQKRNVSDTGTYWCISRRGCTIIIDTFALYYGPYKQLNLGKDTANCLGQAVQLHAGQPYDSYSWSTGANSPGIVVAQSGTFILTVGDNCGIQSDTINVTVQQPTPPPIVRDTMICQHVQAPLLQVAGVNLTWFYPGFSIGLAKQPYITTDLVGFQTLYVSQKIGHCESPKVPINIEIKYKAIVEIGDYFMLCVGRDTIIGQQHGALDYRWNTGERTPFIHPKKTGTYELTVSNECGSASDTAFVEIFPCDECLFIPNAFSPNGDGRSDAFAPIIKCPVYNYRLQIYNRWGEMVFSSDNPEQGWNGLNKNQERADVGVYVYTIDYNSANTKSYKKLQGNLTLLR